MALLALAGRRGRCCGVCFAADTPRFSAFLVALAASPVDVLCNMCMSQPVRGQRRSTSRGSRRTRLSDEVYAHSHIHRRTRAPTYSLHSRSMESDTLQETWVKGIESDGTCKIGRQRHELNCQLSLYYLLLRRHPCSPHMVGGAAGKPPHHQCFCCNEIRLLITSNRAQTQTMSEPRFLRSCDGRA